MANTPKAQKILLVFCGINGFHGLFKDIKKCNHASPHTPRNGSPMKKISCISLFFPIAALTASFSSLAATATLEKSAAAKNTLIYSDGKSLGASINTLFVNNPDFQNGEALKDKKLTQLRYEVTAYPTSIYHQVEICYHQPYQSTASMCISVPSGSSGTTQAFNRFRFDSGVMVYIRHTLTGTPGDIARPSRKERIIWEYSY